ncbi:hypothetical protein NMY22_g7086 [Coprinellus aureogranulatus]|nr:hypothetical protein NMY22_g7086 [Coprinellus aureogranulatus]
MCLNEPCLPATLVQACRFHQSCLILEFLTEESIGDAPAHDYLDDLEGFFFVMCGMFFQKAPDGSDLPPDHRARLVVKGWDSESAADALRSKAILFNPARREKDLASRIVLEAWGAPCQVLFDEFRQWVRRIQLKKEMYLQKPTLPCSEAPQDSLRFSAEGVETRQSPFAVIYGDVATHYRDVVGYFNKAIGVLMQSQPPKMTEFEPGLCDAPLRVLRSTKRANEGTDRHPEEQGTSFLDGNRPKRSRTVQS